METIRTCLQCHEGRMILKLELRRQDIVRQADFAIQDLVGQKIISIKRRGKYLDFRLNRSGHLVLHLGMSGRVFEVQTPAQLDEPHVHLVLHLEKNTTIVYQDARRFGGVWLLDSTRELFSRLGVEPLGPKFTAGYLERELKKHRTPVKNLLLDQRIISGIGNIYADEALFAAGILPDRPASSLQAAEVKRLHQAVKKVLLQGIEHRGTTFRDFRDGFNESGHFQDYLQVYGRYRQGCRACGQPLARIRLGGRSTHYCLQCQH